MSLEVIYKDDYLVAVNKPHGLLVHRTKIADDAEEFALQLLRDQLNQMVNPVHRLDRKTSGVLLFALSEEINTSLQKQFMNNETEKVYRAIVRGYTEDSGEIDYPLTRDDGKRQSAITHFKTLQRVELPIPFGKHQTSRYSLLEITPLTGRMHQIRKHLAHILHPIIGDRPHGCNKQNKLFLEQFHMNTMLLHASHLSFNHPVSKQKIEISASIHSEFARMMIELGFK